MAEKTPNVGDQGENLYPWLSPEPVIQSEPVVQKPDTKPKKQEEPPKVEVHEAPDTVELCGRRIRKDQVPCIDDLAVVYLMAQLRDDAYLAETKKASKLFCFNFGSCG